MNSFEDLQQMNKIISLCLVQGVQPDGLITAIFEKEYTNIETYKEDDLVFLVLTFLDTYEDETSIIKMKYVYSKTRKLLSIYQKIDSSEYKEQWSRAELLNTLINELNIPNVMKIKLKHKVASIIGYHRRIKNEYI